MVITNHQVQSILRTYTRELQRSKSSADGERGSGGSTNSSSMEKVSISSEGQRTYMMNRMTSQVLGKMYPKQDNDIRPAENQSSVENEPVTEGST
jgi:hypothetical protein